MINELQTWTVLLFPLLFFYLKSFQKAFERWHSFHSNMIWLPASAKKPLNWNMEQNKCLTPILVLECVSKSVTYIKVFSVFMQLRISFFVHLKAELVFSVLFLITFGKAIIPSPWFSPLPIQTFRIFLSCTFAIGFEQPIFLHTFFLTSSSSSTWLMEWSFWNTHLLCHSFGKFLT